jgi:ABC-2 type transport system permease protein
MVMVTILSGMILGLPNPLVAAREAGIYRSYRVNGVPAASILVIPALATMLHMLIVAVVITATAPLLFGASLPANWGGAFAFFLLAAFASAGLGLLIGVISTSTRATVLWSQIIFLPSMLLGGLMLPASFLPPTLGKIGMLLPSTHAMNLYHGLAGNDAALNPLWSLLILLAGGALAFGLSVFLFCWDSQNRTRRGHPVLALVALVPYVLGMILI